MPEEKKKTRAYAFDFDGVIAQYDGFKGAEHSNEPVKEVVEVIRRLKEEGSKVIVFSTRGSEFLKAYCERYDIPVDYFNENPEFDNKGAKPVAYVYIDDRTVCYRGETADELFDEIKNFRAYWQ